MSDQETHLDRRHFLKKLAQTAAYAAPVFVTVGARADETSAFERAKRFLSEAQALVARAKDSSDRKARRSLAMEAETEMTEARSALKSATAEERESIDRACESVDRDIKAILKES